MPIAQVAPGIYIKEVSAGTRPIEAVGTSTPAFLGEAPLKDAHLHEPVAIGNWSQFLKEFVPEKNAKLTDLATAVAGFFQNGGSGCYVLNVGKDGIQGTTSGGKRKGIAVLDSLGDVAMVVAPGSTDYDILLEHCSKHRNRIAILDGPQSIDVEVLKGNEPPAAGGGAAGGAPAPRSGYKPPPFDRTLGRYGAFYAPWVWVRHPMPDRIGDGDEAPPRGQLVLAPPSGAIAGIYARTDATRGVHKAPANEAVIGAGDVAYYFTDWEQAALNPLGVNCIRYFSGEGVYVWGARTRDQGGEWRYVNVRRLFGMIEESIARSMRWVVFEPNTPTLWKSIKRDIDAFLTRLWRDGALMGNSPEEAFFVKCDEETNPQEVIDAGQVITRIGIAPVKPAEFVYFEISQDAGGAQVTAA